MEKHVVYSAIVKANEQANRELFGDKYNKDRQAQKGQADDVKWVFAG
jgi:hypothetical protein